MCPESVSWKGGGKKPWERTQNAGFQSLVRTDSPRHPDKSLPRSDLLLLCGTMRVSVVYLHQYLPDSIAHWLPSSFQGSWHHFTDPSLHVSGCARLRVLLGPKVLTACGWRGREEIPGNSAPLSTVALSLRPLARPITEPSHCESGTFRGQETTHSPLSRYTI